MISTKYTMREQNEASILSEIINRKEVSRAELAVSTKLNKASVSAITKDLIDNDLVVETRIGNASITGGRKPTLLTFNGKSAIVIAIDIGIDYIESMLAFIDGAIIDTTKDKHISITKENVLEYLEKTIDGFLKYSVEAPHGIVGITIAIHGLVEHNQIVFTPYYDLDQMDLHNELSSKYDFPVFIQNEANLAAMGEYTFTSESKRLFSISIHSGVGGGIVENGELWLGQNGKAGEIGHSILFPNGKICPCGNHGCLEQYISHKVLYAKLAEYDRHLTRINSDLIKKMFFDGDPYVRKLLKENVELLSIGINNVVMLFDPEIVIINSSVYRKIPELVDLLKTNLKSNYSKNIILRNTTLDDRATLFGGFAVSAQKFLNIQNLKIICPQYQE
ncbi:ROK family transcriptional regulator [Enterococcus sp. HY326]|uniref:ROK family transcriptional regulator n=1 Tax=Enterococcus sp. HY326 TaxID=2971265 RepID=UPI00223F11F9|nr:ROK family transcriptional regulator [Enterococcus sp. HY326]